MSRSIFRCRIKKVLSVFMTGCFLLSSVQTHVFSAEIPSGRLSLNTSRKISTRSPQVRERIPVENSTQPSLIEIETREPSSKITVDDLLGKEPHETRHRLSSETSVDLSNTDVMTSAMSTSSTGVAFETQSSVNHFQFDPTSGSGVVSLPIATPFSRHGLKPNITLSYSPRAGNGPYGMGWNIDFGFIERSTKDGTPSYIDDEDTFIAVIDGMSMELVKTSAGKYRAEVEGAFYNFQYDGERWLVRNGKGTTYYFGEDDVCDDQSRQGPQGKVFRWRLSKSVDSLGNYYLIRHLSDQAFEIYWTGEPGTDESGVNTADQNFFAKVDVVTEGRTDLTESFRGKFNETLTKRISEIKVYALNQLQRKYVFDYAYSQRSGRSLLKQIREYGVDGVNAMPTIKFQYEESPVSYRLVGATTDPLEGDNLWSFRYRYSWSYGDGHNNFGPCPPYLMMPFTESIVATRWAGNGNWNQDEYGRVELSGARDVAYYFYTYFYVSEPKTLFLPYSAYAWNPGVWLNGDYSQTAPGVLNLKAGYNLVEYTDYNQNSSFYGKFLTLFAQEVDLMNSVQLVLPHLAGDFNGDGMADVATYFAQDGKIKVELSTGSAFLPKETWLSGIEIGDQVLLGDFNADGKTDVGLFDADDGRIELKVSDGTAFLDYGEWETDFDNDEQVAIGDFDGDGRSDIVGFYRVTAGLETRVMMNTGTGFSARGTMFTTGDSDAVGFAVDFNGDGLSDWGSFKKSTGTWNVRINKGGMDAGVVALTDVKGFGTDKNMVLTDINADGMVDIGYFDASLNKVVYRLFNTVGFLNQHELSFSFSLNGDDLQLQTGDFNGDGLSDFILYNLIGNIEFAYSDGKIADLLTRIDNGIGGFTEIVYAPSVAYQNINLPFVIPLVSSVTVGNSRNFSATTRYSYEGGLWKPEDREFYGFAKVTSYDADGNYSETLFSQENFYLRGRPVKQSVYSNQGILLTKTEKQWETQVLFPSNAPSIKFVYLKRSDQFVYDVEGGVRRRASQYFYEQTPQLGSPTKIIELGEVDSSTGSDIKEDARRIEMEYVNNTHDDIWLIGFPKIKYGFSYGASLFSTKEMYYYDNLAHGQISKGLMTRRVADNSGFLPAQASTAVEYDDYGNVKRLQDANGKWSTLFYDDDYHLFPLIARNPLGQETRTEFYGINGVALRSGSCSGLFGQKKSVTDLNNVSEFYSYDTFGRLSFAVGQRDSLTYPTVKMRYEYFDDYMRTVSEKRLEHGTASTVKAVEFRDGLGNVIQTKSPSGKDGNYIISGETEFNNRGLVKRKYIPRGTTVNQETLEAIPDGLAHTLVDYDAAGRPLTVVNPDERFSTTEYYVDRTVGIDPNGHKQVAYVDVFGNLIKKEEYRGADGRSAIYPQQAYTLYATTEYFYDFRNLLTKTKDAHGNQTRIFYDRLGRKIAMDDPDMGHWEYGYDANGNMTWQVDAKGQRLDFTYDDLNRLINKTDGTDIDVTYTYDINPERYGLGRLGQVEYGEMSGNDLTRFFYDEFGREIQSLKVIDGIGYYVEREYNGLGNLKRVQYPDGNNVHYHYDDAGRLDAIANDEVMFESDGNDAEPLSKNDTVNPVIKVLGKFYNDLVEPYVLGISPVYAQESQPPEIVSPVDGSMISSSSITFEFDQGVNIPLLYLIVGTQDYDAKYYQGEVTGLNSKTVDGIILNSEPVYVKLWFVFNQLIEEKIYIFQTPIGINSCQSFDQTGKTYLLTRDLSGAEVTANCMNIIAQDVTLDCQGHTISNTNLKSVLVKSNQNGTTIQNCTLESYLSSSYSEYEASMGIYLTGSNGMVQHNTVRHTGSGIYVTGSNNTIQNNRVENTIKAIRLRNNNNVVKNNLVKNNISAQGWGLEVWKGTGSQFINNKSYANDYGMILSYADNTLVRCNQISSNAARDMYLYNGSNNVQLIGTQPAKRYVSPDSDMIFTADACMDMECAWDGDACVPQERNQRPQFDIPTEKSALSDQQFQVSIVVTDKDEDALSFVDEENILPVGARLQTVSNTAGRLEATLTWTPERSDIGDHSIVLAVSDGQDEVSDGITIHVARGAIVEDPKLYVADIEYNVMGQIKKITYGTGTTKYYIYDAVTFRLKRVFAINNSGAWIQDLNYQYDDAGNIIMITDNIHTATQIFKYDHLNRLVEASSPESYGSMIFRYDAVGNVLEKDGKVFAYGEEGSLIGKDGVAVCPPCHAGPHAVSSLSDGAAFVYDLNGNMVSHHSSRGDFIYHVDAENRLVSVDKSGAASVDFRYDGDGGRTKKVAYGVVSGIPVSGMAYPELLQGGAGENDLVTHFIGELYEVDNLHEVKHIYMGSERILSVRDGEEQYIHGDHLGSSNVVEDQDGDLVQVNEYQPFGEFSLRDQYTAGGQESDLYFTQQILDDETGLYYYGARYYDSALGRFISADTVVQAPMDPQTLNRYSYCRNNPVIYTDPSGSIFGIDDIIIGAIIGAVIGGISSGIQTDWNWDAVGRGTLTGAVGGAVFAAVAPALNTFTTNIMRDLSLGAGASGPLSAGWSITANFTSNFMAGAASGSSVMAINGGNRNEIGEAALLGGGFAGGFSVMRDSALLMRAKMVEQSRLDHLGRNASGKSVGFNGDGFKLGGGRYDEVHLNGNPSPLGGHQGGQGQIFGMPYKPGSFPDRLVEAYAGPHDFLNSWGYNQFGNLAKQNLFEGFLGATLNPLNVVIATPVVAASVIPSAGYSIPAVIYGNLQQDEIADMKRKNN